MGSGNRSRRIFLQQKRKNASRKQTYKVDKGYVEPSNKAKEKNGFTEIMPVNKFHQILKAREKNAEKQKNTNTSKLGPMDLEHTEDPLQREKTVPYPTDNTGQSGPMVEQEEDPFIKTNVMKIFTTDGIECNYNLEKIKELDSLLNNNEKEMSNETIDFYETEKLFMFNVVDLLPQDTFRYCLNAYKGITTINERQVSQMVDDITSYIETNYAGDLNDNGAWDDPSGEMAESSASEVEIEPNENGNKFKNSIAPRFDM